MRGGLTVIANAPNTGGPTNPPFLRFERKKESRPLSAFLLGAFIPTVNHGSHVYVFAGLILRLFCLRPPASLPIEVGFSFKANPEK